MSRLASFAVAPLILFLALAAVAADRVPPVLAAQGTLQAAFTPGDDVEGLVVDVIGAARRQVLVQAYLLTNRKIARALVAAHRHGIDVRVLVDAAQLAKVRSSAVARLAAAGIPVWLETKYRNAHNKVIVTDAGTKNPAVITGSFNFTWTAQHKNAENILIIRKNPPLALRYASNWKRHWQDATPYIK